MPDRILIDTAFVLALINRRDQYHRQALELADKFEGHPLLVTDAVIPEISSALARSYKQEAIKIIEEFLTSEEVEVVHLSPQLFHQAFAMYKKYQDKEWSLVDCVSFVVMADRGVGRALTFDRHFTQAGFQALMRETPGV